MRPAQDPLVIVAGKTLRHAQVELVSAVNDQGRWLGTVPAIESWLHHAVDVSLDEDRSRVRQPNAALVLAQAPRSWHCQSDNMSPGLSLVACLYISAGMPESGRGNNYANSSRQEFAARRLDADLVAGPARRPATGVSGPGGAAPRAGPVGPAAAAGHELGDREPQDTNWRRRRAANGSCCKAATARKASRTANPPPSPASSRSSCR